MNKWQKQINRIPKFREQNNVFYKNVNFRKTRIVLRSNIKKYGWDYKHFKEIITNYLNRKRKIFKEVSKELNLF